MCRFKFTHFVRLLLLNLNFSFDPVNGIVYCMERSIHCENQNWSKIIINIY